MRQIICLSKNEHWFLRTSDAFRIQMGTDKLSECIRRTGAYSLMWSIDQPVSDAVFYVYELDDETGNADCGNDPTEPISEMEWSTYVDQIWFPSATNDPVILRMDTSRFGRGIPPYAITMSRPISLRQLLTTVYDFYNSFIPPAVQRELMQWGRNNEAMVDYCLDHVLTLIFNGHPVQWAQLIGERNCYEGFSKSGESTWDIDLGS